jgi:(p)ppGpp synthase/HD superfamily hydrolase
MHDGIARKEPSSYRSRLNSETFDCVPHTFNFHRTMERDTLSAAMFGRRFTEALCMAAELHAEQRRKASGVPYVSHVLAVASLVIESGGTENEAIAALLHDAAEDCGGQNTLERIREAFGPEVAEIVLGCSDTTEYPKPPWRARKENYLRHLEAANHSVQLVAIADKLHNLRSTIRDHALCGDEFWQHFRSGRDGMLWYFGELVRIFRDSSVPQPLFLELERAWLEFKSRF